MTPEEREQLAEEVTSAFAKRYFANLPLTTTAAEYQQIAGELGAVMGRITVAAMWEGPINSDLLMQMRHSEQLCREATREQLRQRTGPGGEISEALARNAAGQID